MHAIARFVGLDLRSLRPHAKYMIIPAAIVVVPVLLISSLLLPALDLAPEGSGLYLLIPAMSALAVVSSSSTLFSNDTLGCLDTLYAALGIPRRHVVAGRYATCLLLMIGLTIAGVLLAAIAALALSTAFDWTIVAALTAGSVAVIGILLAAQLPAYFATTGPARTVASVAPSLILTAIFVGWAIPDVRTALQSWLADANPAWLAPTAIAILGALAAASAGISARLYARRDL